MLGFCRLCSEIPSPSSNYTSIKGAQICSAFFSLQPIPTSPTSTSPTPGGTLGMSKMDAPSMQDVYILSPVSGLYSTRSDACTHRCLMMVITLIIRILPMTLMMALMTAMMTTLLSP